MGYIALVVLVIGVIGMLLAKKWSTNKDEDADEDMVRAWKLGSLVVFVIGIALVVFGSFYVIAPGEVGVEVLFGNVQGFRENGMHVKLPIASVNIFDIKTQRSLQTCDAASSDMQDVKVEAVINYRLDATKISFLYQSVGHDYENKVVIPLIQECVKAGVSQYKVEDIIVKRLELKGTIEKMLKERLAVYYVVLEGVNLQNINFSPEFNKVVEQKQIAEQQIKTAEYNRQRAEKDKQTTILQAQAEAEKQRLLAVSTSKDVVDLKWIEKWNGQLPQVSGGGATFPMVNFNK